jgi:hypothetical protein
MAAAELVGTTADVVATVVVRATTEDAAAVVVTAAWVLVAEDLVDDWRFTASH